MPAPYGIRQLSNWILDYAEEEGVELSNMSLNKLLYFAYEFSLVRHSHKLTNARIEAWEHGPVFREVYRSFKENGNRPIKTRAERYDPTSDSVQIAAPDIDETDAAIIKEGIETLLRLPASVLRELSHASGGPWDVVWHHAGRSNPGMQITDNIIRTNNQGKVFT